jgi:Acetyltransferase (GNAT) domain
LKACRAAPEGVPRRTLELAGITPIMSYRLAPAPALTDRELFVRLAPRRRVALRRAELAGVVVSEIRSEPEFEQYCALAADADSTGAVIPPKFFAAMFRDMVPRRQAVFFLARRGDQPLAGAIFLVSRYRMSCFHAVATRDQDLSALEGPTAVFWHALRVARVRDLPCFDLGAVTATSNRDRPGLSSYDFKREFGGYLEPVYHGEVAPIEHAPGRRPAIMGHGQRTRAAPEGEA